MINTVPTQILEVIDNAIFIMERAEESGACLSTLHNQALVLRSSCWGFEQQAGEPFARSFAMRAEEIDQLANRYIVGLRRQPCAPQAGCDCAQMLAARDYDADPVTVGERGVW